MAEPIEAIVQLSDDYVWERTQVLPIADPIPVGEWLAKLDQLRMVLGALLPRRITDGFYGDGWVVSTDNARTALFRRTRRCLRATRARQ